MSQFQQLIKADLRNSTAVSTLNKANTIKTQAHGLPKDQEATSESYAPVQNVVTPGFVQPALQPTTPAPCSAPVRGILKSIFGSPGVSTNWRHMKCRYGCESSNQHNACTLSLSLSLSHTRPMKMLVKWHQKWELQGASESVHPAVRRMATASHYDCYVT
jgi:hypothetical protein